MDTREDAIHRRCIGTHTQTHAQTQTQRRYVVLTNTDTDIQARTQTDTDTDTDAYADINRYMSLISVTNRGMGAETFVFAIGLNRVPRPFGAAR